MTAKPQKYCSHDGKKSYPTMGSAERGLIGANRRHHGPSGGHAYKCGHCNGFHFTSMRTSVDMQKKIRDASLKRAGKEPK